MACTPFQSWEFLGIGKFILGSPPLTNVGKHWYGTSPCITLGSDSMSDSKQKSSYEHGSDFERLRSYDRLKLRIEGNDYWQ